MTFKNIIKIITQTGGTYSIEQGKGRDSDTQVLKGKVGIWEVKFSSGLSNCILVKRENTKIDEGSDYNSEGWIFLDTLKRFKEYIASD
jgi:hypothetical protein